MTFQLQIENIVGRPALDGTSEINAYKLQLNTYLKQSARTIVDILPDDVLVKDCIVTNITGSGGVDVTDKKIVKVLRNDFGCVEMPLEFKSYAQANSSSIYEPTKRAPVYYIEGQTTVGGALFIKPDPVSTEKGQLYATTYPEPKFSDIAIGNFPDTAEYAVILGASVKLLQYRVNKYLHEDEDIELAQSGTQELNTILGMYNQELQRLGVQVARGEDNGSN